MSETAQPIDIAPGGVNLAVRARRDAAADRFFKILFASSGWLVLVVLIGAALSML